MPMPAGSGACAVWARLRLRSKRESPGTSHPRLPRLLAARGPAPERADRRSQPPAHAVADRGIERLQLIDGIARVDERRKAPCLVDPVVELHARHPIVPAADHRVALL